MKLQKPLTTTRLLLRCMSAADTSDAYLGWLRDPVVNRFLEVRHSIPECKQDLVSFIELINSSSDSLLLGIFLRKDNRHIGNIKIGPVVWRHERSEIGYLIGDRASWGKGYATEAIREICLYGFNVLGLAKITAGVYETNQGSAKALINAGFVHEARIPADVISEGRRIASVKYGLDNPRV